jgi:2-methylcitrate dehydratase PrpD
VLEGEHGFLHVYSPAPKPELLLRGLGDPYLLLAMTLKAYPCHMTVQPVVDAITRFKATRPIDPSQVEAVAITSTARMMETRFHARAPTTLMGAQYSLPWSAAHALCHDAADPASWSEAALQDARVNAIAAAMELREQAPATPNATAEIELRLGGEPHLIVATDWKGAPTNPYSFDEIAAKLQRYARGVIPDARSQALVDRVAGLEDEADVAALAALIRS